MKNTIKMITREEAEEYIAWHKCENVFIAELDGAKIKNDEDFFRQIEKAFEFPDGTVCVNWDSYLDWICDLGWLTGRNNRYAGFSLFIYNHKELSDKIRTKRQDSCIDLFKEDVLPYWEEDVIHCTCNGHGIPRVFNVFLVNDTEYFMKNTIKTITREEAEEYIAWHKCENVFIAELDGAKIKNKEDLFRQTEKAFEFPDGTICVNWDSYLDWMRDLRWLVRNKKFAGVSLFIYNHKELFNKDIDLMSTYKECFELVILPYWEEDVIHCTFNGHGIPRVFNVFLVNDTKDFMSEIEKGLAYKDNWSENELKRYVEIFVENGYGRKDWDPDSGEEICFLYTENGGKALIHSKFPIGIANESFLESEHAFGHLFSKEIHIVKTEDFNKELWFIDLEKLKETAPEIKWIAGPDAVDIASFSALDFVYAVNN